jgi:glycosyltransferase involved in cell wall biosynthesis
MASVRAQSLAEWELLVVLNGCTDASGQVAEACARRDPRIRCLMIPEPGLVRALNVGLAVARGGLIARCDADDRMLPERLAAQLAALNLRPDWDAVTGGVRYVAAPDGVSGEGMARYVAWVNSLHTPRDIRMARFIDAPIIHPAVMIRRETLLALGGYRDGPFPEDYDLWLRFFEQGRVCGRVPEDVLEWHDSPGRLTRTDPRYSRENVRALKHRFLLSGPLAHDRRCRIWGAGPYGRKHARELAAQGAHVDDFIDVDPRKIGRLIGGRPVRGLDSVGPPDARLVLLCVAHPEARTKAVAFLEARGYVSERDYLALQ